MTRPIRMCISYDDFLIQPLKDGHRDGSLISDVMPKFKGILGESTRLVIEGLITRQKNGRFFNRNYSIVDGGKAMGLREDGSMTACLKSLHDNESDIFLTPASLPLSNDKIDILGVVGQSKFMFRSGYSYDDESKDGDLIDSLSSLYWFEWILVIFSLLILVYFFNKTMKPDKSNSRKPSKLIFKTLGYFMRMDQSLRDDSQRESYKQGVFTLVLLSFFVNALFISVIQTDMVTVKKPYVPFSYKDILNNKTGFIRMNEPGIELHFKNSPKGSTDRTFYDSIQKRLYKHYKEKYLKENSKENTGRLFDINDMINQVFGGFIEFGTKTLMTIQTKIICTVINHLDDNDGSITDLLRNKYPWVWNNPDASPTLAALVKRVDYKTSERAQIRIDRLMTISYLDVLQRICCSRQVKLDLVPSFKLKEDKVRECVHYTSNLKVKEVGFLPVMYSNIIVCGNWFYFCLFISFMVLVREHRPKKWKGRQGKLKPIQTKVDMKIKRKNSGL